MARILAQHAIEQFVHTWLSKFRNASDIRRERRFIEKAIKQIEFFLNPPCCVDPESTIEYRRLDNDLTRFLSAQFAQGGFDRRKWKKSLTRAKDLLSNKLTNCCCTYMEFYSPSLMDYEGEAGDLIIDVICSDTNESVLDEILSTTINEAADISAVADSIAITLSGLVDRDKFKVDFIAEAGVIGYEGNICNGCSNYSITVEFESN